MAGFARISVVPVLDPTTAARFLNPAAGADLLLAGAKLADVS